MTRPGTAESPRWGVDGYPYIVGLGVGTVTAGVLAAAAHRGGRYSLAAAAWVAATMCAVPTTLGARYVVKGKVAHRDRLLDQVAWRGDEVVLDVGAGAGLLGIGAAHRAPHGRVVCLDRWVAKDLSGNGPARLRRNAELEQVADRVEIRTGDARDLELPDAAVDVVLSALCLHNISENDGRRQAVLEIARVLRPGGRVVISDLAGTEDVARWLREAGLVVQRHARAPATFPPQRTVVAFHPD